MRELIDLSAMCMRLMQLTDNDEASAKLHSDYTRILRDKDTNRQFIEGSELNGFVLGCIDSRYRRGRPMKFGLQSKVMIFCMCNALTRTNVIRDYEPEPVDCRIFPPNSQGIGRVANEKFELFPVKATQFEFWHFVHRPVIEFNLVDTFSPLYRAILKVIKKPE